MTTINTVSESEMNARHDPISGWQQLAEKIKANIEKERLPSKEYVDLVYEAKSMGFDDLAEVLHRVSHSHWENAKRLLDAHAALVQAAKAGTR